MIGVPRINYTVHDPDAPFGMGPHVTEDMQGLTHREAVDVAREWGLDPERTYEGLITVITNPGDGTAVVTQLRVERIGSASGNARRVK